MGKKPYRSKKWQARTNRKLPEIGDAEREELRRIHGAKPGPRFGKEPVDPDQQCRWCLRFAGPDVDLTGQLWGGGFICDRCATGGEL